MIHMRWVFQTQVKQSSSQLWFIIIPTVYKYTVERNVISPGLQCKSPLSPISQTFSSFSVSFLCILSAGGWEEVFVGKEKVEKKTILWFPHAVIIGLWVYWHCLEGFTVCFCHVQVQKYLIFLFSFCLFLSFRMSWTSQRSTERQCLPYQQKRNGRFTAARRRLDFSNITP